MGNLHCKMQREMEMAALWALLTFREVSWGGVVAFHCTQHLKLSAQDLLAVPANGVEELIFNKKIGFLPSKLASMYIFHFQDLVVGFLEKSHNCK